MKREIRWYDYITINIYWLALTTLSQTNGLVLPLLVQQFVGEETKGAFFGTLRLWTLMVALLAQALMGMLSDHATSRWGRRRPFIFIGTLANMAFIAIIGLTSSLEGMTGYWILFAVVVVQQVASNTAHGPLQGLIPDLVPEDRRGIFSGIKAVLEVPIPIILVAFLIGPTIAGGSIWGGLLIAMGVMFGSMVLTMLVPEQPLESSPGKLDWGPFIRLVLMTALFTIVILGTGAIAKGAGRLVQETDSLTLQVLLMGGFGLVAMIVAVAGGVWASVRTCIGKACYDNPSFTWWVVNRLAFFVGTTNLSTFAVYFLQGRLGYAEEEAAGPASQMMMLVGIFMLLSALPSGWLSDRFGHKRFVGLSGLIAAVGTLILILSPNLVIIYIGGCLIGIATGFFFTANWALGTSLVPREEAGRYLGISNLAGAGAGAVGAYIGGPLADYFTVHAPDHPGLGYVVLFALYGAMFVFSLVALTQINRKAQQSS